VRGWISGTPANSVAWLISIALARLTVLIELEKETGKPISTSTLKRLAKKNKLIWKRMRKSLRDKRDQKKFASST